MCRFCDGKMKNIFIFFKENFNPFLNKILFFYKNLDFLKKNFEKFPKLYIIMLYLYVYLSPEKVRT